MRGVMLRVLSLMMAKHVALIPMIHVRSKSGKLVAKENRLLIKKTAWPLNAASGVMMRGVMLRVLSLMMAKHVALIPMNRHQRVRRRKKRENKGKSAKIAKSGKTVKDYSKSEKSGKV